jgi:hypothetical protein
MNDTARMAYVSEIFSRVWPAKIHGLGLTSEAVQMKFPFWSVDSTVWLNPGRFGCYRTFQYKVVVKRGRYWLDGDLFYILKLQRRLKARWAHELARFAPREAMTA